jgi:hypothetical protein
VRSDDVNLFPHDMFPGPAPEDATSGPECPDIELISMAVGIGTNQVEIPAGPLFNLKAILLRYEYQCVEIHCISGVDLACQTYEFRKGDLEVKQLLRSTYHRPLVSKSGPLLEPIVLWTTSTGT